MMILIVTVKVPKMMRVVTNGDCGNDSADNDGL